MDFLGIGPLELVFILVIAFLVLGPTRMVSTARTLGKWVRELRRAPEEFSRMLSLEEEVPSEANPKNQAQGRGDKGSGGKPA